MPAWVRVSQPFEHCRSGAGVLHIPLGLPLPPYGSITPCPNICHTLLQQEEQKGADVLVAARDGNAQQETGAASANLLEEGDVAPVEGEDTDQWVQCERCRTWRIVPDTAWPAVEADTREVGLGTLPLS